MVSQQHVEGCCMSSKYALPQHYGITRSAAAGNRHGVMDCSTSGWAHAVFTQRSRQMSRPFGIPTRRRLKTHRACLGSVYIPQVVPHSSPSRICLTSILLSIVTLTKVPKARAYSLMEILGVNFLLLDGCRSHLGNLKARRLLGNHQT